jgi:prepilin-type N-terminal cleavage/methylation domain-containing protein
VVKQPVKSVGGFSLVELMIVAAIIGILAAIVLPTLSNNAIKAKEAAAKENLRILRDAIERYALHHNGVAPGYLNDDPASTPVSVFVNTQLISQSHYLNKLPENPFNKKNTLLMLPNNQPFPTPPAANTGWIYKPATKTVKLNWPGNDSTGCSYYDY